MNGKDIFLGLKYVGEDLIEAAEFAPFPAGGEASREKTTPRKLTRPLLIAAIISLMVLLMGCAVVYALRLQDLKLGEFIHTYPRYIDANGEKVYATEVKRDVISLQGIAGSPEFLAAQEWEAYEWDIMTNHPDQIINDFKAPADYDAFLVGNQQMQDKIDEICEKYDLALPGPIAYYQQFETDIFFESLGLSALIQPNAQAAAEDGSGYFYANGNFKQEFFLTLTGQEAQWPHEILISCNLKHKGYFDPVVMTVEDVNTAIQWNYTLSDGTEVLIVKSGNAARIFCDREDAFLSIGFNITNDDDNGAISVMTDQDIELVAEALDFAAMPQNPDMDTAKARLEESTRKHLEEEEACMETWVNPFARDYETYADVIQFMLENAGSPQNMYYGLYDLTGDGETELLIGCADSFGSIKTVIDGEVTTLLSNGTDSGYVLCSDRVFCYQNGDCYYYYRVDQIQKEHPDYCIDILEYDPWEETWSRTKDGTTETITKEAAMAIIDSYGSINVGMKPITEYDVSKQVEELNFYNPYIRSGYREYIENLKQDPDMVYVYGFADLNQDGIEELLIGWEDTVAYGNCFTEALTIRNGRTDLFLSYSSPTFLCENNVIEYVDPLRENWRCYLFLDTDTGEYGNHQYLHYNTQDEVWLLGTYDKTWPEEITEAEAKSIIESHPRIQIEMTPISEYPMDE